MATFRYVGDLQPTSAGNYRVSVNDGTGRREITFNPGQDFTVTNEVERSQLEYAISPWTREYEFITV